MPQDKATDFLKRLTLNHEYDVHVLLGSDYPSISKSLEKLGFNNFKVTKASFTNDAKALFSFNTNNNNEASKIFDCASKLVENTNALVEIERVLYVASVQKDFERQDARSLSSLNLQKRSNTEVLHFGDLHLDFILNTQTRSLLEKYLDYGYSCLCYLEKDGKEYVSITAQFQSASCYPALRDHVINLFNNSSIRANFSFEKLINYKVYGSCSSLPLVTGLKL